MTRLLIVNADDYGLTVGVSRAIMRAHREGIVTSTSALALGPAFARTAAWLDDVAELGVGAHLAAVGEDPPLLSAHEIPTLVDGRGHLDCSWRRFLIRVALRRVDLADVEREFAAQLELLTGTLGRDRLTHLDTHQHLHLWPSIGKALIGLAERWHVPAARATRSFARTPFGLAVDRLGRRFARQAHAATLRTPAGFAGFGEGGELIAPRLVDTIRRLAGSGLPTAEVSVHPGEHGDPDLARYQWGYRWGDETDALVSPAVHAAVAAAGFTLGSFAALAAYA
jgi:predicted glycoside hydrolase/deacetylase ChbG (UPF0249 family)